MKPSESAKVVAVLLAAFPSARVTGDTSSELSAAYERMLIDLDYAATNAAVGRLLATSKFLPSIAEIREATLALMAGEQKPGGEAWGAVLRALKREGVYRAPGVDFVFSDPVTAECVAALGWAELCNSENQVADRARFIELYDKRASQSRRAVLSEGLPAVRQYRAIEAKRRVELEARSGSTDGSVFGKVLELATGADK